MTNSWQNFIYFSGDELDSDSSVYLVLSAHNHQKIPRSHIFCKMLLGFGLMHVQFSLYNYFHVERLHGTYAAICYLHEKDSEAKLVPLSFKLTSDRCLSTRIQCVVIFPVSLSHPCHLGFSRLLTIKPKMPTI